MFFFNFFLLVFNLSKNDFSYLFKNTHEESDIITCDYCDVQLSPSEDLQEHIRDNHECSDMEEDKAEESFQLEDGIKDYVPISEKVDVDRSEESAQLIEESVPSTGVQYD